MADLFRMRKSSRRLLNGSKNLTNFPLMGRIVPEFPHLSYREILVGNYRVIYRFEEEQNLVIIMAVAHERQLLKI